MNNREGRGIFPLDNTVTLLPSSPSSTLDNEAIRSVGFAFPAVSPSELW